VRYCSVRFGWLVRRTVGAVICLWCAGFGTAYSLRAQVPQKDTGRLGRLEILQDRWPRAFFFRVAEGLAANPRLPFEAWDAQMSRLSGIMGKVLDEEIPGRSKRNITAFTRFKQRHPKQVVLLHYNGNARDPRNAVGKFSAGHWIYYAGCRLTRDLPAEDGVSEMHVEDPTRFRTAVGRYGRDNEDVGLCLLDDRGRPDWTRSEQVQLLAVDVKRRVLKVRRGCYGTTPRAFPAGKSWAAAHVSEGPWGGRSHLLWFYNYSTHCPRDSQGRTSADILLADLAAEFANGGRLGAFDGLEFDVLAFRRWPANPGTRRGVDTDGDGKSDQGLDRNGRNVYGIGVVRFLRRLRNRLGPDRLILADGNSDAAQRGFGLLNGIESEGWPTLRDTEIADWSGGLNRHFYWLATAFPPSFNYVNHKFVEVMGLGRQRRPEVPFSRHRLVFAAALVTDSAICYSFPPPRGKGAAKGAPYPVWDELWKGIEREKGWLGRPVGPPRRLAPETPDVLNGAGAVPGQALLRRLRPAENTNAEIANGAVRITARPGAIGPLRVSLRAVPCRGPDLTVRVTMTAEPMEGYPVTIARAGWCGIADPAWVLVRADDPPRTGMRLRGESVDRPLDRTSGATVQYRAARNVGGRVLPAYFCHPPWRGKKTGYTFWERAVTVPQKGVLRFAVGMGKLSPARSDGVLFRVLLRPADVSDEASGSWRVLFEKNYKAFAWEDHQISLKRWAGRRVVLRFVSDAGPANNSTTDHSAWGDVRVVSDGPEPPRTKPVRAMTFVGTGAFTSWFTFREVRTPKVDLLFEFEGRGPVHLRNVAAFSAPDVIVRAYEYGAVLANPSHHPVTLDLAALFPGRRFRRLRGSPEQDVAVNNGQQVGPTVTLGERDALFLVAE